MDEMELLTAVCAGCRTTVGHNMSCGCANSTNLNQNDAKPWRARRSKDSELLWAEESIGYTH